MSNFERFTMSQVAVWIKDGKVLILEDAAKPGRWLIPGGRIDRGEEQDMAFARELKEEIGIKKFEIGEHIDTRCWYAGANNNPVCSLARFIHTDEQEVILSDEHLQARWITEDEINDYDYVWPHAGEVLQKGFEKIK